jgi:hypothetical protein
MQAVALGKRNRYFCNPVKNNGLSRMLPHSLHPRHTFSALLVGLLGFSLLFSACNNSSSTQGEAPDSTQTEATPPPLVFNRYWNDLARWLGGLEALPGSKLSRWDSLASHRTHREFWNTAWATKDSALLGKLRNWARQEFTPENESTQTAFYPLSGSDFMTIHQFFPKAKHYVFFALESEGVYPDSAFVLNLTREQAEFAIENQRRALADLFRLTFQITQYMGRDLSRGSLNGQLPILLAFIARTGHEVINVQPIRLSDAAQVEVLTTQARSLHPQDSVVTGFRYTFRKDANSPLQTLDYWCVDIENKQQPKYPEFVTYLNSLKPTSTYFKAASYLMHYDEYTQVRQAIVNVTQFLLQDDSGFSYKLLKDGPWEVTYYGMYDKPKLEIWGTYQPELKALYVRGEGIRPINFGLGYTNREHNCNLQVGRRRAGAQ